ncbi:MAG TPA: glycosyltransferase [Solirubrobacterales bacterium]|nr:glycosyltransferase [Solirubrobacterales bacterium]
MRVPPPRIAVEPLPTPPTFSVVVPAFEAAGTISETLESVLAQSPPPREVIVVDDGSDDGIEEALGPFESRVRLIRHPVNRGVAAARNSGLRECSGDFVLVVDADDVLLPGRLAALGFLGRERPDLDVLCTDVFFETDGQRQGRFYEQRQFPVDDQRGAILEWCFPIHPAIRRERLEELGGFDESLPTAEDWDCALRMVLSGSLAGLYDRPLELYRIRPGSLSDTRAGTLRDRVRMLEKARSSAFLRPGDRPVLERSLRAQHHRAVLAEAQSALALGAADARRRGLALARCPSAPAAERIWGLGLFALPRRSWNLLRRRGPGSQLQRVLPHGQGR